jgi:hypothetical protein
MPPRSAAVGRFAASAGNQQQNRPCAAPRPGKGSVSDNPLSWERSKNTSRPGGSDFFGIAAARDAQAAGLVDQQHDHRQCRQERGNQRLCCRALLDKSSAQQHRVDREEWQRNDNPQHRHGRTLIDPASRVAAGGQTGIEVQEDDKDDKGDVPVSEPRRERASPVSGERPFSHVLASASFSNSGWPAK